METLTHPDLDRAVEAARRRADEAAAYAEAARQSAAMAEAAANRTRVAG